MSFQGKMLLVVTGLMCRVFVEICVALCMDEQRLVFLECLTAQDTVSRGFCLNVVAFTFVLDSARLILATARLPVCLRY